jgi:glucose/arabinose dehydrogenase
MRRYYFIAIFLLSNLCVFAQPPIKFRSEPIELRKKLAFNLLIPQGYKISVAAEGLERPRFFAKSPDGRLFVTDMHNISDNKLGRVLVLEDWNDANKKFTTITTYLDSLHNPNQVAFYSKDDTHFIYVAETGKLSYFPYTSADDLPNSAPTIIADFPDYGLSYKYGGWHLTRSIAFYNNKIYVSVGSSCDACVETEEIRATIVEMDPDGMNQKIFARGIRNAVGIEWVKDTLWVTHMGRDNRGPDKPEELMHTVVKDGYYGWPYYYQFNKRILSDTAFTRSPKPAWVKKPVLAPYSFKAHSAPLGFEYVTGFSDPTFNNSFFVALHGSTSVWRQRGNAIVQVMRNGSYREIVTGFLQGKTEDKRFGRPCDIIQWDERSFFISDDKNGVIYYLWKEN